MNKTVGAYASQPFCVGKLIIQGEWKMKVIVGLGNPGSKYKETKHNIGFITLDEIAYRQNVSFNNSNFEADIAEFL